MNIFVRAAFACVAILGMLTISAHATTRMLPQSSDSLVLKVQAKTKASCSDRCRENCRTAKNTEVPPVSWTPEHLCSRSPQWQERTHLTLRSSGVR